MPTLSHIAVHPIKALDPTSLEQVSITDVGGLSGDRVYGIVDESGEYVHGKRTPEVHRLDAEFDLEGDRLVIGVRGEDQTREFRLERDREDLEAWLSEYFDIPVELKAGVGGAQTDSAVYADAAEAGPTIIAAATIREVASWYEGIDPEEMRLRLRPNLVVEGVPPFWADKLVADGGRHVRIGDVTLEGVMSVPRCAVPTQDPHTGEVYDGFRETFIEKREATLPEWTDPGTLNGNLFSLMAVARIPESERDKAFCIGESVRLAGATAE